ncbi:MAG TPA: T9SS type A sorting domain-containing protein [Flavipsychrobacter sp.]|nr:T9SS type A sorting domain-containing protein [Flavipsychrobacter sp.]
MKNTFLLFAALLLSLIVQAQSYWNKVASGTNHHLVSVSFGSNMVGYISGTDSVLLKTVDGGNTWNNVTHTGMDFSLARPDIVHVNFVHADTGFAVVSNFENPVYVGTLYKTTDGGSTWNVVNGGFAAYSTFFSDANNGYVVGSQFFAGKTVVAMANGVWDNGNYFSWQPSDFLYTIDCRNNTCITAGDSGYVYRTHNGGTSWDTVKTATDSTIRSLKFLNDSVIVAATDYEMGGVMISTDMGANWHYENSLLTFFYPKMKSVAVSKKDSFIVVGKVNWDTTGVILWWNGSSPMIEGVEQAMNSVAMRNDSVGFAVGNNGLIMSNKGIQVGINSVQKRMSLNVYPNPSDGRFKTEMETAHSVKVYDLTGRLIYANETKQRNHIIDLSRNATGVYLLKAEFNNQQIFQKILRQ